MRKLFLLLLLLAGLLALQAQTEANKNASSAKLLLLNYSSAKNVEDFKMTNSRDFDYHRSVVP